MVHFYMQGVFSASAGGIMYHLTVEFPVDLAAENLCSIPYEDGKELEVLDWRQLEFSLIHPTTGIIVSTCLSRRTSV